MFEMPANFSISKYGSYAVISECAVSEDSPLCERKILPLWSTFIQNIALTSSRSLLYVTADFV